MLLTPNELKDFENFYLQENEVVFDNYYNKIYYDIFKLTFVKKYTIFGIFNRTNKIEKEYKFKRKVTPSKEEGYIVTSMSPEAVELKDQLKQIVSDKWHCISDENYEFFVKKFPERFV